MTVVLVNIVLFPLFFDFINIFLALFTFLHILSHFSVHHIFIYYNLLLTYLC